MKGTRAKWAERARSMVADLSAQRSRADGLARQVSDLRALLRGDTQFEQHFNERRDLVITGSKVVLVRRPMIVSRLVTMHERIPGQGQEHAMREIRDSLNKAAGAVQS